MSEETPIDFKITPVFDIARQLANLGLENEVSETQEILNEIKSLKSYIKREKIMCPIDMIMVRMDHYIKLSDFYNANHELVLSVKKKEPEPEKQSSKKCGEK
jgi:hypothetical protein